MQLCSECHVCRASEWCSDAGTWFVPECGWEMHCRATAMTVLTAMMSDEDPSVYKCPLMRRRPKPPGWDSAPGQPPFY
jgi:hypothetical protein